MLRWRGEQDMQDLDATQYGCRDIVCYERRVGRNDGDVGARHDVMI